MDSTHPEETRPRMIDLLPLMLMEALRKIWGSIFVRRIQTAWREAGVLCPNQFGCVPGKGTDGAVAEFLNAPETAKERRTPVYLTSWDIRRAFDSVPKPLVTLALRRLGIPEKVTEYIRNVDEGVSVVRTPWALRCTEMGEEVSGFQGERGIGQGDVISPLIWTAVFDILLAALSKVTGGIITCSRNGYVAEASDVGYADDLVSVQGDLQSLQEKADLVSAFCVWTGLTLAVEKFRAFAINWGNEHIDMGIDIVIHMKGWVPMTEHIAQDQWNIKASGSDMGYGTRQQHSADSTTNLSNRGISIYWSKTGVDSMQSIGNNEVCDTQSSLRMQVYGMDISAI